MAVQIVHLLEEVHIHHNEDEIAMIHLPDFRTPGPLITSQDLACDCQQHSIGANGLRDIAPEFGPGNHQRSDEYGHHSQPCFPDAESAGRGSLRHRLNLIAASHKSDSHKPCHGRDQRYVEYTSRVVKMQIDGFTGDQRSNAVGQGSREELQINSSPRPTASPPDQQQTGSQRQLFAYIEQVEAPAIHRLYWMHVLPWNDHKQIQEQPPCHEKCKIKSVDANGVIVLLNVRLNRHRSHHRDHMQEQNDIADEWIRRLLSQVNFEISRHDLRGEPHAQANAHQSPEESVVWRCSLKIADERDGCPEKDYILQNVAKSG